MTQLYLTDERRELITRVVGGIVERQRRGPLTDDELTKYLVASIDGNLFLKTLE